MASCRSLKGSKCATVARARLLTRARVGRARAISEALCLQPLYCVCWRETQYQVPAMRMASAPSEIAMIAQTSIITTPLLAPCSCATRMEALAGCKQRGIDRCENHFTTSTTPAPPKPVSVFVSLCLPPRDLQGIAHVVLHRAGEFTQILAPDPTQTTGFT